MPAEWTAGSSNVLEHVELVWPVDLLLSKGVLPELAHSLPRAARHAAASRVVNPGSEAAFVRVVRAFWLPSNSGGHHTTYGHTRLHHTTSHQPHNITSLHIASHHITPHPPHHTTPHQITTHHITSHHITSHHTGSNRRRSKGPGRTFSRPSCRPGLIFHS